VNTARCIEKNIGVILPVEVKKTLYDLSLESRKTGVELGLLMYRSSRNQEDIELSEIIAGRHSSIQIPFSRCRDKPCIAYFHTHPLGLPIPSYGDVSAFCIAVDLFDSFSTLRSFIIGSGILRDKPTAGIAYYTLYNPASLDRFCRELSSSLLEARNIDNPLAIPIATSNVVKKYFSIYLEEYVDGELDATGSYCVEDPST